MTSWQRTQKFPWMRFNSVQTNFFWNGKKCRWRFWIEEKPRSIEGMIRIRMLHLPAPFYWINFRVLLWLSIFWFWAWLGLDDQTWTISFSYLPLWPCILLNRVRGPGCWVTVNTFASIRQDAAIVKAFIVLKYLCCFSASVCSSKPEDTDIKSRW